MKHSLLNNALFSDGESEMLSSLVDETIAFSGISVVYVPRSVLATDDVLNEITSSEFKDAFTLTIQLNEVGAFSPNDIILGKIGMDLSAGESSSFSISRSEFANEVPNSKLDVPDRPNHGDLIYIPNVQQLLQIIDVDTRDPHLSGGDLWVWSIKCEPYRYDQSPIAQGMHEDENGIDQLGNFWSSKNVEELESYTADSLCEGTADSSRNTADENVPTSPNLVIGADSECEMGSADSVLTDASMDDIKKDKKPTATIDKILTDASNSEFGFDE